MTAQPEAGPGLAFGVELAASVSTLASEIRAQRKRDEQLNQAIYAVPSIPVGTVTGSGTLDVPALAGPRDGNVWDVKRISAVGFTAGTVSVYMGDAAGLALVYTFSAAGVATFSSNALMLRRERLVFVGATLTGTATISIGVVNVAEPWVGAYLL